uniref:Uncharacterized protein n=1 Tax=Leersia perrieri TaxID=77586 RepID=A0A0D9W434_9ORYZ
MGSLVTGTTYFLSRRKKLIICSCNVQNLNTTMLVPQLKENPAHIAKDSTRL